MNHNDNLIRVLGIESLPDGRKAAILDAAGNLVEQRLLLRLYKALPEGKRDAFNTLLENGDKAAINDFMLAESPDFVKWVEEETAYVKDELKSLTVTE